MFRLLVVFCAFVACSIAGTLPAEYSEWEGRIVGGQTAGIGQFPYQVSLRTPRNQHFCGGSIANSRWIVTAAHCTYGQSASNIVVVVGTNYINSGGKAYPASRVVNHPGFNQMMLSNDIACIQTQSNIQFTNVAQPIPLGSAQLGGGTPSVASGWGQTSHPGSPPQMMQFINLQIVTNAQCRSGHSGVNAQRVYDGNICTSSPAGKGMCMGDSGGPLAAGGALAGAVSWGNPCARGNPDVFTRISYFRSWIVSVIGQ